MWYVFCGYQETSVDSSICLGLDRDAQGSLGNFTRCVDVHLAPLEKPISPAWGYRTVYSAFTCPLRSCSEQYIFFESALQARVESVLLAIQFTGNALCYYALIPQIMKQFREKTGQWSPITSGLCLFGNLVRVYTTLQQTRDKMILTGYMFGAVAHSILIAQYFLFKS